MLDARGPTGVSRLASRRSHPFQPRIEDIAELGGPVKHPGIGLRPPLAVIQAADVIVEGDTDALAPRQRLPVQFAYQVEFGFDIGPVSQEAVVDDVRLRMIAVELTSKPTVPEGAQSEMPPARPEWQVDPVTRPRVGQVERQVALTHDVNESREEPLLQFRRGAHRSSMRMFSEWHRRGFPNSSLVGPPRTRVMCA
jgi:hypothetical protein